MLKIILSAFLCFTVFAEVKTKFKDSSYKYFEYKKVCEAFRSDATLVYPKTLQDIDCMGKIISVTEFCKNEFPANPNLARCYIDLEEKRVVCQFAREVWVDVGCDSKVLKNCKNPKKQCEDLKKNFATMHKIYHASHLVDSIKCYFSAKSYIK